jgi:hypothetical protein
LRRIAQALLAKRLWQKIIVLKECSTELRERAEQTFVDIVIEYVWKT